MRTAGAARLQAVSTTIVSVDSLQEAREAVTDTATNKIVRNRETFRVATRCRAISALIATPSKASARQMLSVAE
jgi:hypothetical protein